MARRKRKIIEIPPHKWLEKTGGFGNQYRSRDYLLKKMGFKSYAAYLQSPLWKKIRTKVLERDKYECYCCLERADQVHHSIYDIHQLSGGSLKGLFSLCSFCHRKIEFDEKGVKRTSAERITERMHSRRLDFEFAKKNGLKTDKQIFNDFDIEF